MRSLCTLQTRQSGWSAFVCSAHISTKPCVRPALCSTRTELLRAGAQFNKSNYDGRLSDVWSCGVMLYIMLFGSYPFQDGAHQQFNRTVKARTY